MTRKQRVLTDDELNGGMFSIFRPRLNLYSDREFFLISTKELRFRTSNFPRPPLPFNFKNSKAS